MRWAAQVFSVEVRKLLAYRVDFWMGLAAGVTSEITIAYFLWKAVFKVRGVEMLEGFTLPAVVLYYLLAALLGRMIRGTDHGVMSTEIYDGTLSRFLIYPISFVMYKYVAYAAQFVTYGLQLAVALGAYLVIFGSPAGHAVTVGSAAMGTIAAFCAASVYYCLASTVDMAAFWADNVWSLNVMLRMMVLILGGGMIPLTFFPAWFQHLTPYLPFGYIYSFPIRCFMGDVGPVEWIAGLGALGGWLCVILVALAVLWNRGTRQYSGVGI